MFISRVLVRNVRYFHWCFVSTVMMTVKSICKMKLVVLTILSLLLFLLQWAVVFGKVLANVDG
jgi:hypothetical protein